MATVFDFILVDALFGTKSHKPQVQIINNPRIILCDNVSTFTEPHSVIDLLNINVIAVTFWTLHKSNLLNLSILYTKIEEYDFKVILRLCYNLVICLIL